MLTLMVRHKIILSDNSVKQFRFTLLFFVQMMVETTNTWVALHAKKMHASPLLRRRSWQCTERYASMESQGLCFVVLFLDHHVMEHPYDPSQQHHGLEKKKIIFCIIEIKNHVDKHEN